MTVSSYNIKYLHKNFIILSQDSCKLLGNVVSLWRGKLNFVCKITFNTIALLDMKVNVCLNYSK